MKKFETIIGVTGSEIERAAMISGIVPQESRFEALVKREVAKGLAKLAGKIDPFVFNPRIAQH